MIEWEAFYTSREHVIGTNALFSKLILSYVSEADRILELGAGLGNNIPDVARYGLYYAIDGSQSAVEQMHKDYPNLRDRIVCGDFTLDIPFERGFDAVVERASVAHNDLAGIKRTISNVFDVLKPGGIFASSDWFSVRHSEFSQGRGKLTACYATRCGYEDGQFADIGKVHFSSEAELIDIFAAFDRIFLQERLTIRKAPGFVPSNDSRPWIAPCFEGVDYTSAVWDIVCRRPL